MTSITDESVKIQTTSEANISTPVWFGEIVVISSFLCLGYLRRCEWSPMAFFLVAPCFFRCRGDRMEAERMR